MDVPGWAFYSYDFSNGVTWKDPSGVQVRLWGCQPDAGVNGWDKNQIWYQIDNHDGGWTYQVRNSGGAFCLDSLRGHNYDGSPVEVFGCNGDNAQKWIIGPGG